MEGLRCHVYDYVMTISHPESQYIQEKKLLQKSANPRYEDCGTLRRTTVHYKQLCNESENKSKDNLILQLLDSCKAHGPFHLSCG